MVPKIDPKRFGLHPTTQLEQSGKKQFTLVIDRKSRIIMKDGKNILAKAARIKEVVPGAVVYLRTTAPLCSKTKALLAENNVELRP